MGSSDEPSQPTPDDLVEFVEKIAFWKADSMMPLDVTFHSYPLDEGRLLGHAKKALGVFLLWREDTPQKSDIEAAIALLGAKLKAAVVDKEAGRVEFRFTGTELFDLRRIVGMLKDYAHTKASDARQASRPKYRKGKR